MSLFVVLSSGWFTIFELYKYLSEIIIGQVLNPFKGYLNLFKDCQSFLNTKQPVWIIIYLETQLLLCWTGCICFRFSHHGHLLHSYIHSYSYSYSYSYVSFIQSSSHTHSRSLAFILLTPHSSFGHLLLANMKQPILICFIGVNIIV